MEVTTSYKETEIGRIPSDWDIRRIADIAFITTGDKDTQDKDDQGRYPFFVRSNSVERINSYSFDGEAVLTAGDGVGTGKVFHYINGRFDYHQRVYKISNFDSCVDGFYFYKQFSNRFYDRVMAMTAKSSVDSVRMEMIADMLIPLPSRPEQRAIADALSDVDALIERLDALIAKKRAIKTATMQRLLTGQQRLPGFSAPWTTKRLGEVFDLLRTANNSRKDLADHGDVAYIHYGDIHTLPKSHLDLRRDSLPFIDAVKVQNATPLQNGDLVMVDASEDYEGVGKSIEVSGLYGQHAVAGLHTFLLRGDDALLADGFKGYMQHMPMLKEALHRIATGTSVYGISKTKIKDVELRLPPVDEQQAIATILTDMDAEIEALRARRDKTQAIKQGMMQELLTGRTRLV